LISAGTSLGAWSESNPEHARAVLGWMTLAVAALPFLWGAARRLLRADAPVVGRFGIAFAGVFAVIAGLQFAGVVDMAAVLEQWLTFQGI
jgi:hypothetical protein